MADELGRERAELAHLDSLERRYRKSRRSKISVADARMIAT